MTLGLPGSLSAETYQYDNTGRLTKVTYDDGSSINYQYDNAGNILSADTCISTGPEICGDGIDNNCDGVIDEGCCPVDGDLNGDGSVTPQDALMAFQHYLGIIDLSVCQLEHADVNNDSSITPADALCIFLEYLGLPSCFTGP